MVKTIGEAFAAPDLGESNVSLTEDAIKRKIEHIQTFYEFISREGLQIRFGLNAANTNVYTVPKKKIFYLFAMNVQSDNSGIVTAPNGWEFIESGSNFPLCQITGLGAGDIQQNTLFPGIPIRFDEDITFSFVKHANMLAVGFMFGFEVDKEISFRR